MGTVASQGFEEHIRKLLKQWGDVNGSVFSKYHSGCSLRNGLHEYEEISCKGVTEVPVRDAHWNC